jgi:Zn-dependent protease
MLNELYILPILLFSVIIHEISHGYAALRLGDPTAQEMGRLTLNPIPHIDLMGSIIVPLFSILTVGQVLIAWAKPVPINPMNFSNRQRDDIIVSAVGPISNLIMALLCAIATIILLRIQPIIGDAAASSAFFVFLSKMFYRGIYLNVILGVFNLVPIPPLDGSHVLAAFLPEDVAAAYSKIGFAGIFLILILMRIPAFLSMFNTAINIFYAPLYQLVVLFA